MYLPPNSFSMRLLTTTSGWPGGELLVDVQQHAQPADEEAEHQRDHRDGGDDGFGRPTTAVTYRRSILVAS